MKEYFYDLSDHAKGLLKSEEIFLFNIQGESSDFTRMNQGKIRHGGHVDQCFLEMTLIVGQKKTTHSISLSTKSDDDKLQIASVIQLLRDRIPYLSDDPYLYFSKENHSTEDVRTNGVPESQIAISEIMEAGKGTDLVGIYSAGTIFQGFSNSMGQRNWYENSSFNFDFSLYHEKDKAVKSGYAGFGWDSLLFKEKMEQAKSQLEIMMRPPKTIQPGTYSVYLTPNAISAIVGTLSWKGFSARRRYAKASSLNQMIYEGRQLDPLVTIRENTKDGVACKFQSEGFIKPDYVSLIEKGEIKDALVSPRSSMEYDIKCNGASAGEFPESTEILPGQLKSSNILATLDTGVYLNNLHYLNYSDVNVARMTGLTRFAAFWVENGEIKAPINVMRFDETIYNIFGENLVGLTEERDLILSADTYHSRSTESFNLPGAVVKDFRFTL